jgi:orotidine-5'-phosphate decarboxylase
MSYGYFVSIKEVVGNYLMSFIIEEVYYLAIVKPNVIDLGPSLVSRINNYKHLISRIWLAEATS